MSKTPKEKSKRRRPAGTDAAKAEPVSLWSLDSFFYAFIVLGVLVHWLVLNYEIINGTRSAKWPQTSGMVVDVHTSEHSQSNVSARPSSRPGGSGATHYFYEVVPTYEYSIEGKQYINNKVTTNGGWFFGSQDEAKQKADNLKPQAPVVVYYDPADPSSAVLERGVAERTSSGMIVTIPAAGGAAGMAFNYFSRYRIPERRRRLTFSIAAGTALAVILALAQWFVLSVLV